MPGCWSAQHAQFRPHRDNGAGAGQSTSLIVAAGDYTGGRIVVEGDENDIQYKPLEFNGWTQVQYCKEHKSLWLSETVGVVV